MKNKIEKLLSKEYFCTPAHLNQKGTIYSVNVNAKQPYIKILAYRNCVVACTSKDLSGKIQKLLQDKNRDEIFELPFVYGQTIHYIPDSNVPDNGTLPPDCRYKFFPEKEISTLDGLTGFENSVAFDEHGTTPAKAVCIAENNGKIIGAAGASETSVSGIWEIGIDVVEEHRNAGLGTYLVSNLTKKLLARDITPFYSASVTNIASQMVASRCGYIPFWVDTFGTTLDGSSVYPEIVRHLSLGTHE